MKDKELLKLLGINDTTITFGLEEDIQIAIEKKIDNYLNLTDFKTFFSNFKRCLISF